MSDGFILMIIIGVVGFAVQMRLKSVFKKYSKVAFPGNLTGREIAEKMLHDNKIYDVKVISTAGQLTDHFDPRNKTVNLSESVYDTVSVSAAAVAAHECGHAIQHAISYGPLKMRSTLVPIVQFSSTWAQIVLLIGIFTINIFPQLFIVGIIMFTTVVVFSLITLPVEYDASRRALEWLSSSGTIRGEQHSQAKEALSWAARTYLVSALSSIATLVYYLGFLNNDD